MKKSIKIIIAISIVMIAGISGNFAQENSDLSIKISYEIGEDNSLKVNVEFHNLLSEDIRILNRFTPWQVFFSIKLLDENNMPANLPGTGKISFKKNSLDYILVGSGQSYTESLNLSEILKSFGQELKHGNYTLKVSYHNQYGDNCIKGWYESDAIVVQY